MLNGSQLGGQSIRLSWGQSPTSKQTQQDQTQWNGYYWISTGYDAYTYAPPAQDPSMYYGVMLLLDMEIISNLVLTNSHSSDLCYLRDWRVVVSVSEAFGLVFIWLELLMVCGFCALLS
uniref:Uncharacterized protein n=1 Tax=Cannabis sativa TaxID=3483 RepID=A0A803QV90_CANSA